MRSGKGLFYLDFPGELTAFLVGTQEHEAEEGQQNDRRRQSYGIDMALNGRADLIDNERYRISESALIADGKPCPFCAVHLTLDRTDGSEAGSAEQIEDEEGEP